MSQINKIFTILCLCKLMTPSTKFSVLANIVNQYINFPRQVYFYRVAFGPLRGSGVTGLKWLVRKYIKSGCNTAINRSRYILLLLARAIPSGADSGTMISRRVRTYKQEMKQCVKSMRMIFFSEWHRHTRKKKIWVLLSGVEPMTFRLQVRMLYHWATGDLWELRL